MRTRVAEFCEVGGGCFCRTEVDLRALAGQQQDGVKRMEDLRRGLMNGRNDSRPLLHSVVAVSEVLQHAHDLGCGDRIEARSAPSFDAGTLN